MVRVSHGLLDKTRVQRHSQPSEKMLQLRIFRTVATKFRPRPPQNTRRLGRHVQLDHDALLLLPTGAMAVACEGV